MSNRRSNSDGPSPSRIGRALERAIDANQNTVHEAIDLHLNYDANETDADNARQNQPPIAAIESKLWRMIEEEWDIDPNELDDDRLDELVRELDDLLLTADINDNARQNQRVPDEAERKMMEAARILAAHDAREDQVEALVGQFWREYEQQRNARENQRVPDSAERKMMEAARILSAHDAREDQVEALVGQFWRELQQQSEYMGRGNAESRENQSGKPLDEFLDLVNEDVEEVNPHVYLHQRGNVELVFHEDTGGAMMIYYEGANGEEADLEANVANARKQGGTIVISRAEGHIAPEGMYKDHYRDLTVSVSPSGEFSADRPGLFDNAESRENRAPNISQFGMSQRVFEDAAEDFISGRHEVDSMGLAKDVLSRHGPYGSVETISDSEARRFIEAVEEMESTSGRR